MPGSAHPNRPRPFVWEQLDERACTSVVATLNFASERHLSVSRMFLRTKTEQRVLRLVRDKGK